jgi:hypothetical protein
VANSGDGGGGSNGEESEREKGASSGREEGERGARRIYRERERGEGRGRRGERKGRPGSSRPLMSSVSMEKNVGEGSNRCSEAPLTQRTNGRAGGSSGAVEVGPGGAGLASWHGASGSASGLLGSWRDRAWGSGAGRLGVGVAAGAGRCSPWRWAPRGAGKKGSERGGMGGGGRGRVGPLVCEREGGEASRGQRRLGARERRARTAYMGLSGP